MEEIFGGNSAVVTVSLILCAVLAAVGTAAMSREVAASIGTALRRLYEVRYRGAALGAYRDFQVALEQAKSKASMLSYFSTDYPSVFNEANWARSQACLDDLEEAYNEVSGLIEAGDYKEALCLSEFFCADGASIDEWKYRYVDEEWDHLFQWRSEQDQIVRGIAKNISNLAAEESRLGVVRSEGRRSSGVTLEKLRRELCID